jgi:toxin ParE1/3/4
MRVRWSLTASLEYREIIRFIAADRPSAAARIADGLFTAIESLSTMPNRGRGTTNGMRELVFYPYIILYRVTDIVDVVRIRHGARLQ